MDVSTILAAVPWKELIAAAGAAVLAGLTSYSFYAKKIAETPEPYEKAKLYRTVVFAGGIAFVASYWGISADVISGSAAATGLGILFENIFTILYRKYLAKVAVVATKVDQVKSLLN